MRILLAFMAFFSGLQVRSQKVVDVDNNNLPSSTNLYYTVAGEPVNNVKYIRIVEGSPFFFDNWVAGKIITSEGIEYDSLKLRLDLIENTVHFIEPVKGDELIAVSPLKNIILNDPSGMKKEQFINSNFIQASGKIEPGWYQLLDSGTVILYKRYIKSIIENKPYGSATYEQTISTTSQYYLLLNNTLIPIKTFKHMLDLLKEKKSELAAYLADHKHSGKSDEDYISIITYFNRLINK